MTNRERTQQNVQLMNRRAFLQASMLVGSGVLLAACGSTVPASSGGASASGYTGGPKLTLRMATDGPGPDPNTTGIKKFAESLMAKTNGDITPAYFFGTLSTDETQNVTSLKLGTVDVTAATNGNISSFDPEIGVLSLPYLFKDFDQHRRAFDGAFGAALASKLNAGTSARALAWWTVGARSVWNKKHPVSTVADMKGLKLRTQPDPVQIDTFNAMGAEATPISFNEVFTSLQTGVVDGADNDELDIELSKFYEVTKYYSYTRHFILSSVLLISQAAYDKMSPGQHAAVAAAAKEASTAGRAFDIAAAGTAKAFDQSKGIVFNEVTNLQSFIDAVQPVYAKYTPKFGQSLIDLARNA
jgi:tripartite ATP-independent transporter DctP family solute receptor